MRAFAPNAWGFYDPSGNVWQWVADWYRPDYYAQIIVKADSDVQELADLRRSRYSLGAVVPEDLPAGQWRWIEDPAIVLP